MSAMSDAVRTSSPSGLAKRVEVVGIYRFSASVTRASPAPTGHRGVYEVPCTVSSNPRSERATVANGNDQTVADGARSSSSARETEISGQKKAPAGKAARSQRYRTLS